MVTVVMPVILNPLAKIAKAKKPKKNPMHGGEFTLKLFARFDQHLAMADGFSVG